MAYYAMKYNVMNNNMKHNIMTYINIMKYNMKYYDVI